MIPVGNETFPMLSLLSFLYVVHKVGHTGENRTHIQGFAILIVTVSHSVCVGSQVESDPRTHDFESYVYPSSVTGLKVVLYEDNNQKFPTHCPFCTHS